MKTAAGKSARRCLVTGGAGFIGPHIIRALLARGYDVAAVDNLSTGKRSALPSDARFYKCDIRGEKLARVFAFEQPDLVVHLAAQTNVRYSVVHPREDADINIMGTLNVVKAARHYGAKKIIFASSGGEVYGQTNRLPTPENHPLRPKCPYGLAKVFGEGLLAHYGNEYGLDWVALRLANVYGPGQDGMGETGISAILIERIIRQLPITKIGDWTQTRDFVYIDDTVAAFLKAIETDTRALQAESRLINIGTGVETSVLEVQAIVEQLLKRKALVIENGPDVGAPQRKALECKHAERVLNWTPKTSLAAGLKACVKKRTAQAAVI